MSDVSEGRWGSFPTAQGSTRRCKQGRLFAERVKKGELVWELRLARTGEEQLTIGFFETLEQARAAGDKLAEDELPNVHVMRIKAAVANNAFPYCKACERWLTVRDKFLDGPWTQFHYLEDGEMCPEQITWVMENVKNPRLQTPDPETVLCE